MLPINYTPSRFRLGGLNGSLRASNLDMTAWKDRQFWRVNFVASRKTKFTLPKFFELKILTVLANDGGYRFDEILNGSILVGVKTDKLKCW